MKHKIIKICRKRSILFAIILSGCILMWPEKPVSAVENNQLALKGAIKEEQIFSADVIIKKYRIHDGRHQYRRWNETKHKWVDPYWIDL